MIVFNLLTILSSCNKSHRRVLPGLQTFSILNCEQILVISCKPGLLGNFWGWNLEWNAIVLKCWGKECGDKWAYKKNNPCKRKNAWKTFSFRSFWFIMVDMDIMLTYGFVTQYITYFNNLLPKMNGNTQKE